jgi:hypothetical protein
MRSNPIVDVFRSQLCSLTTSMRLYGQVCSSNSSKGAAAPAEAVPAVSSAHQRQLYQDKRWQLRIQHCLVPLSILPSDAELASSGKLVAQT